MVNWEMRSYYTIKKHKRRILSIFSSLGWSFIPNWQFCENESQAMLWSKYFVECLGFSPIDFYEENVFSKT